MKTPPNVLEALTGPGAYKVCRLLRAPEFTSFCRARGLNIDDERLRKLERLELLKPMLRLRKVDQRIKIRTLDGNRYEDLGPLDEGETWKGETKTELLQFGFRPEIVASWREHGVLWSPWDGPSPHDAEIDAEPRRHVAYYSEFQVWDAQTLLQELTLCERAENALDDSGQPNGHHKSHPSLLAKMAQDVIEARKVPDPRTTFGLFCQVISDRYYPQTQSDERMITVSRDGTFHGWKWETFAASWQAEPTRLQFELDRDMSRRIHSQLNVEQGFRNPLHAWRGLTRFVAVAERKKLKGDALLAESLGEMSDMLRRFHEDAFEEVLEDPRHVGFRNIDAPVISPDDDPYRALELEANLFHLNPKPRLVLIVEGQTEEAVIPLIFEHLFGVPAARFGIQVRGMRGVGNATGSKKDSLSALWRLVDFLHLQQTVALVLLDREGLAAKNIAKGLTIAPSVHFPDRLVTRPDYVKLWKLCFELDNFSNSEIAAAMTSVSGAKFKASDVVPSRTPAPKNTKAIGLADIYQARTGHSLNKIALAKALVDLMFGSGTRRRPENRPINRFLEFAAEKANLNHQPTTAGRWERNQRSGYLGAIRRRTLTR